MVYDAWDGLLGSLLSIKGSSTVADGPSCSGILAAWRSGSIRVVELRVGFDLLGAFRSEMALTLEAIERIRLSA